MIGKKVRIYFLAFRWVSSLVCAVFAEVGFSGRMVDLYHQAVHLSCVLVENAFVGELQVYYRRKLAHLCQLIAREVNLLENFFLVADQ